MTELPPDRPEQPDQPPRGRQIAAGVGAAVLATLAVFGLPIMFGGILGSGLFSIWLAVPVVLIVLGQQISRRRGSGFGLGVAWGCGIILLLAGGLCIALINSFDYG